MKYHYSRYFGEQVKHIEVKGRVANMVKHPVILMLVFPEPADAADGAVCSDPLIRNLLLINHYINLIKP